VPVVNRGKYPVPTSHLDQPLDPTNILKVADAALRFYDGALADAEHYFVG